MAESSMIIRGRIEAKHIPIIQAVNRLTCDLNGYLPHGDELVSEVELGQGAVVTFRYLGRTIRDSAGFIYEPGRGDSVGIFLERMEKELEVCWFAFVKLMEKEFSGLRGYLEAR